MLAQRVGAESILYQGQFGIESKFATTTDLRKIPS